MNPDAAFQKFERRLDDEWLRQRLQLALPADPIIDEETLARAMTEADPLARESRISWLAACRALLDAWPGRLAFACAAVVLVFAGFVLGRMDQIGRHRLALAPPIPAYTPETTQSARLGIVGPAKPESARAFAEAMAFHGSPEFVAKALPLLRRAVAEDPSNDQAQFWLGVVLLARQEPAEAARALETAVRLAPSALHYKDYLMLAYLALGEVDRARALQTERLKQP